MATETYKVHLIPTEEASNVYLLPHSNKLCIEEFPVKSVNAGNHHIYLTSPADDVNREYKVIYNGEVITVGVNRGLYLSTYEYDNVDIRTDLCVKIIASTDKSITPNSWIPQSIVEIIVEHYNKYGNVPDGIELEVLNCKQPESCNNSLSKKCICPKGVKPNMDGSVILSVQSLSVGAIYVENMPIGNRTLDTKQKKTYSRDEVKKFLAIQRHNCQIERNKRSHNDERGWFVHCEDVLNAEEPNID